MLAFIPRSYANGTDVEKSEMGGVDGRIVSRAHAEWSSKITAPQEKHSLVYVPWKHNNNRSLTMKVPAAEAAFTKGRITPKAHNHTSVAHIYNQMQESHNLSHVCSAELFGRMGPGSQESRVRPRSQRLRVEVGHSPGEGRACCLPACSLEHTEVPAL